MKELIQADDQNAHISVNSLRLFASWYLFAALSFITVVIFFESLFSGLAVALGYKLHVHFGAVDTLPHDIKYWSDFRVNLLFAFPSIASLFLGGLLTLRFFLESKAQSIWAWVRFWVMVFFILYATTELSLALINVVMNKGALYQGFSVTCYWYGITNLGKVVLFVIALIIDFVASLFASPILFYLAPRDFNRKKRKKTGRVVVYSYFLTVLFIFPIAIFLSFPAYHSFFVVMFIHALLWVPGLMNVSNESLIKRSSGGDLIQPYSNYVLLGITIAAVVIIKVVFSY